MLRTRLLTAVVLVPIVALAIWVGGFAFLALLAILLALAEIEFCQLARRDGYHPAIFIGVGLLWLLLLDAHFTEWGLLRPALTLTLLGSLAWQLFHREGSPVADWSLTVVGGLYLGMTGACLILLRMIEPDGLWWTLTVVPSIMLADSGAYFVGRAWGRHKLAPTLSPGKTWEGYIAGVVTGGLLTGLLGTLWSMVADGGTTLNGMHGLVLGVVIAAVAPLGDLAVSMIKRSANVKDSGSIIPGHGGALDRVDSVLWAAVIGYFYVIWFASGS